MSERVNMPGEPETLVHIRREDNGTIMVVFGACMTAADLAAAFASLPADAWISNIETTWLSQLHGCRGQDHPDEAHRIPVGRIFLRPEKAEAGGELMSATHPGRFPLTEAEKAERKRKADEFAAQQDATDPQVRSDRMYRLLAMEGRRLIKAGDKQAEVEQRLLERFTPTDLKVAVAIASGRLTKQAWNEMGSAGREKLFRPHGFTAWEDGS